MHNFSRLSAAFVFAIASLAALSAYADGPGAVLGGSPPDHSVSPFSTQHTLPKLESLSTETEPPGLLLTPSLPAVFVERKIRSAQDIMDEIRKRNEKREKGSFGSAGSYVPSTPSYEPNGSSYSRPKPSEQRTVAPSEPARKTTPSKNCLIWPGPSSGSWVQSAKLVWYKDDFATRDTSRHPVSILVGDSARGGITGHKVPEAEDYWHSEFYEGREYQGGALQWRYRLLEELKIYNSISDDARPSGVYQVEWEFRNVTDHWVWMTPYFAIESDVISGANMKAWQDLGYWEIPPGKTECLRFYAAPWGVMHRIATVMLTNVRLADDSLLTGGAKAWNASTYQSVYPQIEDWGKRSENPYRNNPRERFIHGNDRGYNPPVKEFPREAYRYQTAPNKGEVSRVGGADPTDKVVDDAVQEIDHIFSHGSGGTGAATPSAGGVYRRSISDVEAAAAVRKANQELAKLRDEFGQLESQVVQERGSTGGDYIDDAVDEGIRKINEIFLHGSKNGGGGPSVVDDSAVALRNLNQELDDLIKELAQLKAELDKQNDNAAGDETVSPEQGSSDGDYIDKAVDEGIREIDEIFSH